MAEVGKWKVCGCWMSQQLIQNAWGKREISGTKDNTHFQRDGRKLALGHKLLQLCCEAEPADLAAESVLITCSRTLEMCVRNWKRIC